MEQNFFAFSLIIEGTTDKVLQFIMPPKTIYNKNLGFIKQKMYFEHYREVQSIKSLIIDIIFLINFFLITFSELPPLDLCYQYTKMCCSIVSM
jgi:hypothetical protein